MINLKTLLEKTFECLGDAVLVVDASTHTILKTNSAVERIFGYPPDELVGRKSTLLHIDPQHCEDFRQTAHAILGAGGVYRGHFVMRRRNGTLFPADHTVSEIRDVAGERTVAISVVRDLTDLQRVETRLRETREQYHTLFEKAPTAMAAVTVAGRFLQVNAAFCRTIGFSRDELFERTLPELTHAEDRSATAAWFRDEGPQRYRTIDCVKRYVRKSGTTLWGRTTVSRIGGKGEHPDFFVMTIQDITARRKAERILRESERMKSEFISTAAHELNTPLTSILGYCEILRDPNAFGISDPQQIQECIDEIQTKGERLADMVNDLLDLSRIEARAPLPLKKTPCSLSEIVEQTLHAQRRQYPAKHFECGPWEAAPDLCLDRNKIEQALTHLLGNAAKFSRMDGRIRVTGKRAGAYYQVAVEDNGIGMTAEQTARVFENFYRADTSDTAVGGLGLGLGIAKNIVTTHGGRIWIQSAPGKGTTVFFTLPVVSEAACRGNAARRLTPEMPQRVSF